MNRAVDLPIAASTPPCVPRSQRVLAAAHSASGRPQTVLATVSLVLGILSVVGIEGVEARGQVNFRCPVHGHLCNGDGRVVQQDGGNPRALFYRGSRSEACGLPFRRADTSGMGIRPLAKRWSARYPQHLRHPGFQARLELALHFSCYPAADLL